MEEILEMAKNNLQYLKNEKDIDYSIITDFKNFPTIIYIGKTRSERLQLLVMCYYHNPRLKELQNATLDNVLEYIKNTDEYFERDEGIISKCVDLINEVQDNNKNEVQEIKSIIDRLLDSINGINLSLYLEKENLKKIGLLDEETEKEIDGIRNRLTGAYKCCQFIFKEIIKLEKGEI